MALIREDGWASYAVEVDVSLGRPPCADATVYVIVSARNEIEAELVACQMVGCDRRVTMPVGSRLIGEL